MYFNTMSGDSLFMAKGARFLFVLQIRNLVDLGQSTLWPRIKDVSQDG